MYSVWATIFELKKGLIERLRVTPASRFALLMGPILMWAAWTLISATILVVVSIPFGFEVHIAGLLLFAVLLAMLVIVGAAWSTALTILMKAEIIGLSAIVTGLNLPLLLTAGVILPFSLAPGWMRARGHVNPLYYAVEAGRDLAAGTISTDAVALAFAIITRSWWWWSVGRCTCTARRWHESPVSHVSARGPKRRCITPAADPPQGGHPQSWAAGSRATPGTRWHRGKWRQAHLEVFIGRAGSTRGTRSSTRAVCGRRSSRATSKSGPGIISVTGEAGSM
jgi:hypothetical protein